MTVPIESEIICFPFADPLWKTLPVRTGEKGEIQERGRNQKAILLPAPRRSPFQNGTARRRFRPLQ